MPTPQTLAILVKPMFLPEIHTKDCFQRWEMWGEYPKRKGKCPKRISPDWIYTNCLQDDLGGAISVIADVFHKKSSLPFVTYGVGFSLKIAFHRYQTWLKSVKKERRYGANKLWPTWNRLVLSETWLFLEINVDPWTRTDSTLTKPLVRRPRQCQRPFPDHPAHRLS